jgi:legumain
MKILLVLALLATTTYGAQFAVLVAGSNGWYNYRHQSDVCHSYHILRNNGIPANNIIVMAYDDIANSPSNPFPGTMFNKPTGTEPGVNVYSGCVIDYKGASVTAANFLAIIQGDNESVKGGNGRVLESGPDDEVFIYYSDHGSVGLIAFPVGPFLYANDQLKAFQAMYNKKMFKQLTYYLEACESGSMFQQLPKNINIYGLSASNPSESSWATYCPPNDEVNGKHIGSCLGDEFSVNWMENTEANNPSTYTLQEQFAKVHELTLGSEAMQWGDLSFTGLPIGTFQGMGKKVSFLSKVLKAVNQGKPSKTSTFGKEDQREAKANYLLRSFNAEPTNQDIFLELAEEIATTRKFAVAIESFASK